MAKSLSRTGPFPMLMNTLLDAAGVLFFCTASLLAVISLVAAHPHRLARPAVFWLVGLGCASLLSALVVQGVSTGRIVPLLNRFDATAVYSVFLMIAGMFFLRSRRTQGVMAILAPFATVLLALCLPSSGAKAAPVPHAVPGAALVLHLVAAFAGYSVFSLASILGCAYLVQDHNLKHRHFGTIFERLPALETLDHLISRLIGIALLLLTISLVLGFYLIYESGSGPEWFSDPKVVATMVTWAICALLVHMCANVGQHGRRVALLAVIGLIFVLFSMVGIHQLANSIHDFV